LLSRSYTLGISVITPIEPSTWRGLYGQGPGWG